MNAKTCKQLRRLAGTRFSPSGTRYLPLEFYDRHMMVQDLELDAQGNLPTNPDGTPKLKRFDYLIVKPIRVDPDSPRGRYLDLKRAQVGGRGVARGTFDSTGLSIRVNA